MSSPRICNWLALRDLSLSQTSGGLFHDAQVCVMVDHDAGFEEAQLGGGIDVVLERSQIGQTVRIAVVVLLSKEPAETLRRQLQELRCDLCHFCVILGVEIPPLDPQDV